MISSIAYEDGQLQAKEDIIYYSLKNLKSKLFMPYYSYAILLISLIIEVWTANPFGSFWCGVPVGSKTVKLLYLYI